MRTYTHLQPVVLQLCSKVLLLQETRTWPGRDAITLQEEIWPALEEVHPPDQPKMRCISIWGLEV